MILTDVLVYNQQMKKWKNRKYMEWVAEQPCIHCGTYPVQVHHIRSNALGAGMGLKAPDYYTMPVCQQCHMDCHSLEHDRETQYRWILQTIGMAITNGILKMS
jgi:ferredoxin